MIQGKSAARSIYLLKRVETVIKNELEDALKDFSITPGQYTTMSLLKTDVECSSAALARRVGISAQSMSEMITLLERKAFVQRREKPSNRRVLEIGLTPLGQQMLSRCEKQVDRVEDALFKSFNADEITILRKLLERIINARKTEDE